MPPQYSETDVKTPTSSEYHESLHFEAGATAKDDKEVVEADKKPLKKFLWWRVTKLQRVLYIVGIVVVLLVVFLLIFWYVILKAIIQHNADKVKLGLNYVDVSNISDSGVFGVELSINLQYDVSIHARTDATTASMIYNDEEIGTFEFPGLEFAKGKQNYNLTISNYLTITNQDAFDAMAADVIASKNVTVGGSAKIKMHFLGLSYGGLTFKRELTISGLNNFQDPQPAIEYLDFWGCTGGDYTIDINVTVDNVASMGVADIGRLNMSLYYGDDYLGYAMSLTDHLAVPRGDSVQQFRAVMPSGSSAFTNMIYGFLAGDAQFFITGENPYATSYEILRPILELVNMSIQADDALQHLHLNTSCNLTALFV